MQEPLKSRDLEGAAVRAITDVLRQVPFLQVEGPELESQAEGPDFKVRARWPGGQTTLLCEVKRSGQPAIARDALVQLQHWTSQEPGSTGVLIAPYISPTVARMCADKSIGAVDLSGNVLLSFGNVYIRDTGKPNRFTEQRELRSLFAPKSSRVLRVLLENPARSWLVQDLAREAKVSIAQVSEVKKSLHAADWLAPGQGVRLSQPEVALRTWADRQGRVEHERLEYYSPHPPEEVQRNLLSLFPHAGKNFGLCGLSAAWIYAPVVPPSRVSMYVDWDPRETQEVAGLKLVPSGGNVVLIQPRDWGVFYIAKGMGPWSIVGPVQTFVDCMRSGGRGEEAAEAILEQRLRPMW